MSIALQEQVKALERRVADLEAGLAAMRKDLAEALLLQVYAAQTQEIAAQVNESRGRRGKAV